jgi:tetratricopeptide (TPR) repeat protein
MDPKRKGFPNQIDARSDLFSLGVMLCELLLGDHPFGPIEKTDTLEDLRKLLLEKQQKGARPKWSNNPLVDKRICRLLDRCLSFRSEDRPQSAAELVSGLRKCLSRPQRLRRWAYLHTRLLVATTVISIGAASLGTYWLIPKEPYPVRQFNQGMELYRGGRFGDAIDYFNRAVRADPQNAEAQFARGRTFQQMGQFDAAESAFLTAYNLRPEGRVAALLGYCSGGMDHHEPAIAQDSAAIEAGFETAEVYNNRGYSLLKLEQLENAEKDLKKAIQLDETLQAPHLNLALLQLVRTFKSPEIAIACQQGLAEIHEALNIGPKNADLYYFEAFLYVRAATQDKTLRNPALDYLEKAVANGFPPHKIDLVSFTELMQEVRFRKLSQSAPLQVEAAPTPRLLDPVRD